MGPFTTEFIKAEVAKKNSIDADVPVTLVPNGYDIFSSCIFYDCSFI